MALPTLAKTYSFSTNELHGGVSALEDHREVLFAIKTRLTGWANSPWTVHSSSNGVTASLGDLWLSTSDLSWNWAGIRSWIVLTTPNGGQFLIDLIGEPSTGRNLYCNYSTGGLFDASSATTSVPPTAPDDVQMFPSLNWFAGASTAQSYRLHFIHSNDGENSFVIGHHNQNCLLFIGSVKVQNPVTGWDYPYVAFNIADTASGHMTYQRHRAEQNWYSRTTAAGVNFTGSLSSEGFLSDALGQNQSTVNSFTGDWGISPVGFASTAAGARGRHGTIADMWYAPTILNMGDTLEENVGAPTRSLAVFDDLIVPWDGSVPLIA